MFTKERSEHATGSLQAFASFPSHLRLLRCCCLRNITVSMEAVVTVPVGNPSAVLST